MQGLFRKYLMMLSILCLLSGLNARPVSPLLDSLLDLYFETENSNRSHALELAHLSLREAIRTNDIHNEAVAWECIGVQQYRRGKYNDAKHAFLKAQEIYRKENAIRGLASICNNIGLLEQDLGNYSRAVSCYTTALVFDQEIKDTTGMAYTLNNLGTVCMHRGEIEQANVYFCKAMDMARLTNDSEGLGNTLNNLGLMYQDAGDLYPARKYFGQALQIALNNRDDYAASIACINLGLLMIQKHKTDSAAFYLGKANELIGNLMDIDIEMEYLMAQALLRQISGNPAEANFLLLRAQKLNNEVENPKKSALIFMLTGKNLLLTGQPQKALDYYNLSMRISKQTGIRPEEISAYKEMAIAFSAMGEYDSAGFYILKHAKELNGMYNQNSAGNEETATNGQLQAKPVSMAAPDADYSTIRIVLKILTLLTLMMAGLVFLPRLLKPLFSKNPPSENL